MNNTILRDVLSRRKINLDITHRCTLLCPTCMRQIYTKKGLKVPGEDMSLSQFEKIINYFDEVLFCGQASDPIFHPEFLTFLKILNDKGKYCQIHTAASHKPEEWYMKAFETHPWAEWRFGIDGGPETSNIYRINQDSKKLFNIMLKSTKILKPKRTHWSYIIFSYNEDYIETAKQIAKENNIILHIIKSSRFDKNNFYKPKNKNNYIESAMKYR